MATTGFIIIMFYSIKTFSTNVTIALCYAFIIKNPEKPKTFSGHQLLKCNDHS